MVLQPLSDKEVEKASPSVSKARSTMVKFITPETEALCRQYCLETGTCKVAGCGYNTSKSKIGGHCRQHFTRLFCRCRYQNASRDTVVRHQKQKAWGPDHGILCYEVDKESFGQLCQHLGWKRPSGLEECIATVDGTGKRVYKEPQPRPLPPPLRKDGHPQKRR